jgi:hypothetical protein
MPAEIAKCRRGLGNLARLTLPRSGILPHQLAMSPFLPNVPLPASSQHMSYTLPLRLLDRFWPWPGLLPLSPQHGRIHRSATWYFELTSEAARASSSCADGSSGVNRDACSHATIASSI